MWQVIANTLTRLLLPSASPWVRNTITTLIPSVVALVVEVVEQKGSGDQSELAIKGAEVVLDETLDELPAWKDIGEERRDKIIGGLAELALFIVSIAEADRSVRKRILKDARKLKASRIPSLLKNIRK